MLAIISHDSLSAAATTDWVHSDHLGGLAQIISATGTPVPLGSRAYSLPQAPGQHRTLDDLYYNRYRDYDPTLGRYIQADPIGLDGGPSPYNYAMNNPLRYTDPTGENPVTAGRFAVRAGRTVGAGLTVWCRANIALCMRTIGPTAIRVSKVCAAIARAASGGGGDGCDGEWRSALRKCTSELSKRYPNKAITGGFRDLEGCAKGLVSEDCGGNKISKDHDPYAPGRGRGRRWR